MIHPRLDDVFVGLTTHGVRWCVLRGQQYLGEPGGDVDLLVSGDDLDRAHAVFVAVGFVPMPRRLHPWHRFYLSKDRESGEWLKLDVVTRLDYGRAPAVPSRLEDGCLGRTRASGNLQLLDETDQFWTVALHCLLDKGFVSERRAQELTSLAPSVVRPSAGEAHVAERLGPSAPQEVVEAAASGDWDRMIDVVPAALARPAAEPGGVGRARRRVSRVIGRARPVYAALWRQSGQGWEPVALSVVETSARGSALVLLRHAPGAQHVTLVVRDEDLARTSQGLRNRGFVAAGPSWLHLGRSGLERVRLVGVRGWLPSERAAAEVFARAVPMAGRSRCLEPAPSDRLLMAARALRGVQSGRRVSARRGALAAREVEHLSPTAWEMARRNASEWDVADELTSLAPGGRS